jgi:hypothetical protein
METTLVSITFGPRTAAGIFAWGKFNSLDLMPFHSHKSAIVSLAPGRSSIIVGLHSAGAKTFS